MYGPIFQIHLLCLHFWVNDPYIMLPVSLTSFSHLWSWTCVRSVSTLMCCGMCEQNFCYDYEVCVSIWFRSCTDLPSFILLYFVIYIHYIIRVFTLMLLADAFIRRNLHLSDWWRMFLSVHACSVCWEPMILALFAPCSIVWASGKHTKDVIFNTSCV